MAGRVARNFIESLLSRADIVELIDSYLKLRKAGRNYVACCPFIRKRHPRSASVLKSSFIIALGVAQAGTH